MRWLRSGDRQGEDKAKAMGCAEGSSARCPGHALLIGVPEGNTQLKGVSGCVDYVDSQYTLSSTEVEETHTAMLVAERQPRCSTCRQSRQRPTAVCEGAIWDEGMVWRD